MRETTRRLRTTGTLAGVLALALSLAGAEQTESRSEQCFDVETLPGDVWELKAGVNLAQCRAAKSSTGQMFAVQLN